MLGILGRQRLLDALDHDLGVVRVEPGMAVDGIALRGLGVAMVVPVPVSLPCACGSNVAPVRSASSFRPGASCSVTTSTRLGSDFTTLIVNGSTVSDMRKNRSALLSARHLGGPERIGVRGGCALHQQLGRADPRHHLRDQGVQRLDGHDHLEVRGPAAAARPGSKGQQDRDGHAGNG